MSGRSGAPSGARQETIEFDEPEAIDEQAVVVAGTLLRVFLDALGETLSRREWVVTFHEGKLFRMHVSASREEAIRECHAHGVSLGLYSVASRRSQ